MSLGLGYWFAQVETDHRAGNLLPEASETRQNFDRVNALFDQSQSFLYVVFEDVDPADPGFLSRLDSVGTVIEGYEGVEYVLSLSTVPYLVREGRGIVSRPLLADSLSTEALRGRLLSQPFLRGLLLSEDGSTTVMLVKIEPAFNNTAARVDLVDAVEAAIAGLPGDPGLAGHPHLRTQYAKLISAEAPLFTFLALLISLVFLFATFRSWRSVLIPTVIVGLGIVWTIGLLALFGYQLNVVISILPALIVIIGMANAIHLMTKFFDLYRATDDRRKALTLTIRTVGMATFLTGLTTAIGFAVLVLSRSPSLITFGIFAAAGILILYVLSVTLIPLAYLWLRPPTNRQGAIAERDGLTGLFDRLARYTRRHAVAILLGTVAVVGLGVAGALQISSDIYVFSDFNEDDPMRQDLARFERHFGGVLPMEVVIEAKTEGRMRSLATMRRIERLQRELADLEPVGRALAMTDLVKLANQAYFGGNPATYRLPSGYELPFLQSALAGLADREGGADLVENIPQLVDSTFSVTRLYLGVSDIGTTRMNALADTALARAQQLFPAEQFDVFVSGIAITSTRAGENLVSNLIVSLAVALALISVLMALLFRSVRLTLISLIPNVVPLLLVGGAMGATGITLKPSTALIFSLAFGIAVDDTIHFLAKYRLLRSAGLSLEDAIRATLRETGKAILFTSLVLMSGFLVFTLSSFGGTVNMGALTALTLGIALLANLVLLPALLYQFGPRGTRPPLIGTAPATNGQQVVTSAESREA